MSEEACTEPAFQVVALNSLMTDEGLDSCRPSLESLFTNVFEGLQPKSIIEVAGESKTGKTSFVMDLIAQAIMPEELNGCNADVLFLKPESKFSIWKLLEMTWKHCKDLQLFSQNHSQDSSSQSNLNFVRQQLAKLHILECRTKTSFNVNINNIERILRANRQISLIVLDSIGLFYYEKVAEINDSGKFLSKDSYVHSYLEKFKEITSKFNVSIVYTRSGFMSGRSDYRETIPTHRIVLESLNKVMYTMKTISDNKSWNLHYYSINNDGLTFLDLDAYLKRELP